MLPFITNVRLSYHMRYPLRQHERIKCWLRLKGSSLAQIARDLNVTPTTVTIVSQGLRRSRRIESAIALRLGVTADRLWPDKYAEPRSLSDPGFLLEEGQRTSAAAG